MNDISLVEYNAYQNIKRYREYIYKFREEIKEENKIIEQHQRKRQDAIDNLKKCKHMIAQITDQLYDFMKERDEEWQEKQ